MNKSTKIYALFLLNKVILFGIILSILFCCKSISTHNKSAKYQISPNLKWSERMALTLIKVHPNAYQIDEKTEPKWDYVHGLVLSSIGKLYLKTNNEIYFNYVKGYADATIDVNGNIPSYKFSNYNIDMLEAGNILFYLYERTNEKKYLTALQTLRKQISEHPRTLEGGFWHKKVYPNQMWLDGLYMGSPYYAQYTSKFEQGKELNDVAKQFELIQKHLLDKKTGLLYHGWDESKQMQWANQETGTSPNFWSRSLGWYAMALVDVLDYFPDNHPKKAQLISYLNSLSNSLIKFQHESGLWYQVTDLGSLSGNYLEASGSAMFSYALAKGVNKGYLPKEYRIHAQKAFDGIVKNLIKISPEGNVIITQCCAVAGLGGNPYRDGSFEYYINEKKKDNDPKATGPFILAALELNR